MSENEHVKQSSNVSDFVERAFFEASNYENVRPGYPVDAVKFFLEKLGALNSDDNCNESRPFTILELGSGTGKLTRTILEVLMGKNIRVIASDPVKSMCEQFKVTVPETEIIQCPAEKIRKYLASLFNAFNPTIQLKSKAPFRSLSSNNLYE